MAPVRVNLGGEGEVPGVLNVQGYWFFDWAIDPTWRCSRDANKTFQDMLAEGHWFLIADNTQLPFATASVHEVITNSVPLDITTHLGPGVQSSEIHRILRVSGMWIDDGLVRYVKP
jgi:hypothetical protein